MDLVLLLALLIVFVVCFYNLNYKRKTYQDPLVRKIKYDVSQLDPKLSRIEFFSSDESYTEDKDKIFLCLKDETGHYYDYNMLIYVAIHECSHALTDVIDVEHVTPEFRGMFEHLLTKAYKLGIYDPNKSLVTNYCGININPGEMQRI
ncbi:MAG: hypothetical protein PHG66_01965 [Candidatus Colwellbacteria bacterium]|nr:hypothetical protein [Candidatus Colwellbacteria bacterium]